MKVRAFPSNCVNSGIYKVYAERRLVGSRPDRLLNFFCRGFFILDSIRVTAGSIVGPLCEVWG
jgi:hypothetical protein